MPFLVHPLSNRDALSQRLLGKPHKTTTSRTFILEFRGLTQSLQVASTKCIPYLIGSDGQYRGFIPPGTPADRMVSVIRPLIATNFELS